MAPRTIRTHTFDDGRVLELERDGLGQVVDYVLWLDDKGGRHVVDSYDSKSAGHRGFERKRHELQRTAAQLEVNARELEFRQSCNALADVCRSLGEQYGKHPHYVVDMVKGYVTVPFGGTRKASV